MSSIISFFNVRMNGGMKNPVMPYAALGVGLAIVLTVGLTAIAGVVSQPLMGTQQQAEEKQALTTAPAPAMTEREAGVNSKAGSAATPAAPVEEKSLAKQEKGYLNTETPAGPFEGLFVAIPYIAAAVVGSVVFVVARKHVGL